MTRRYNIHLFLTQHNYNRFGLDLGLDREPGRVVEHLQGGPDRGQLRAVCDAGGGRGQPPAGEGSHEVHLQPIR